MRLAGKLAGNLEKWLEGRRGKLAREVTEAVQRTTLELRDDYRGQIRQKFSQPWVPGARPASPKFQKIVRAALYPRRQVSLSAAGQINFNSAWFSAHVDGAKVRSSGGRFLVIPLPAAERQGFGRKDVNRNAFGRFASGSKAGDANIAKAVRKYGELARVPVRGGRFLLVARPQKAPVRRRAATATRRRDGSIPLFLLVPSVNLRSRFDEKGPATRAALTLADRVQAAIDRGMEA